MPENDFERRSENWPERLVRRRLEGPEFVAALRAERLRALELMARPRVAPAAAARKRVRKPRHRTAGAGLRGFEKAAQRGPKTALAGGGSVIKTLRRPVIGRRVGSYGRAS